VISKKFKNFWIQLRQTEPLTYNRKIQVLVQRQILLNINFKRVNTYFKLREFLLMLQFCMIHLNFSSTKIVVNNQQP